MSEELWTNDAVTTLAGGIGSGATSVTLATGTGALFPNPGAGQFFRATMFAAGSTTGTPNEVVFCTARSTDTLTIVRGQEGTTPTAWNAGDSFVNQFTAGAAAEMAQQPDVQLQAGNWAVDSGSANAVAVTLSPVPVALVAGLTLRVMKGASPNSGATTLNVNASGAVGILFQGAALAAGDLPANQVFTVTYDGTAWELLSNPGVNEPNGAAGGDLSGSYPNPTIGANKVTATKLFQGGAGTVLANITGGTANFAAVALASLLTALGFTTSFSAANSSVNFFGAFIIKFGISLSPSGGNGSVAFTTPFPNNNYATLITPIETTPAAVAQLISGSITAAGFSYQNFTGTSTGVPLNNYWVAFGN